MGPLDDQGVKGALVDKAIAEKLNGLFASVFTTEDTEEIPMPDQSFLVDGFEELDHIEMKTEVVLEQIDKVNTR